MIIDLTGFALSDDADEPDKFAFPAGTSIAANDYLIIRADGDTEQEGLHTDFGLRAGCEAVLLSDTELAIVDSVSFGEHQD